MRMSPPTSAGAAVRVFSNVTGCTSAAFSAVRCRVGWKFHRSLRKSSTTGAVKVTAAPTRTGSVVER